jgi:hypothetical protein
MAELAGMKSQSGPRAFDNCRLAAASPKLLYMKP